jgi:hypothetical protein
MVMDERPSYEVGFNEVKGIKRAALPIRRLVRRLLWPIFVELDNHLKSLNGRQAHCELRETQLELREADLELRQARLEVWQKELNQRHNELDQRHNELDQRHNELDQSQNLLLHHQDQPEQDIKAAIDGCLAQVDRKLKALLAMELDRVAIARRLAALEDHVEALLSREANGDSKPLDNEQVQKLIPYPGLSTHDDDERRRHIDNQTRAK